MTEDGAARVRVHTVRQRLSRPDTLPAYLALAERFGRENVYLLESAAGPGTDCKYEFTGFGTLLTVSVTRGVVEIEGAPALRAAVFRRVWPLLDDVDGSLRLRGPRELWRFLRAVQGTFDAEGSASRFQFGFLGYFGYDTVRYIEELPYLIDQDPELPDVHLVLYQGCLLTDLANNQSELLLYESATWISLDQREIVELLEGAPRSHPAPAVELLPETAVRDDTTRETFVSTARRCLEHIAIGDIYQVQIGHEVTIHSLTDPLHVYQRLRERNASPYHYLTVLGKYTIIGASPELFVRMEDGNVLMRPIAGTIPRGVLDDEAAAAQLRGDPKELAEHTMLVDLCRNDIGRICQRDTLDVPEHFTVERYSHVQHLVSTVVGQAAPGKDSYDIIPALFPAGTMTGAPKIRAMEIIETMERSRRGLYAGALGLIDIGGYLNLALCIRTLIHHDGAYRTRASAGIVADSNPDKEWTETLAKSSAAFWAVTGKELL
jgi:anthranilate/para-aminobenzoate synthase component I